MNTLSSEQVWTQFRPRLQLFVYQRVPDAFTADDLMQGIYLKIHMHLDTLRNEDRLESWVFQITRNVVHDYYRSSRPMDEVADDLPDNDADDDKDVAAITRCLSHSIRDFVELLPDEYREALILTEFEGFTQRELAQQLGISLSGAKSRVQRGRKLLHGLLLNCCAFEQDRYGTVIDFHPRCGCNVECA
jgi:RNA polymerase sigma-70 factor, ECF subfamily